MNCIQEGIIPTKYYEKTTKKLHEASGTRLNISIKYLMPIFVMMEYVLKLHLF